MPRRGDEQGNGALWRSTKQGRKEGEEEEEEEEGEGEG